MAKTKLCAKAFYQTSVLGKHTIGRLATANSPSIPLLHNMALRECIKINLLCHTALRVLLLFFSISLRRTSRFRLAKDFHFILDHFLALCVLFGKSPTVTSKASFLDLHLRSNENNSKSPKNMEKFLSSTYGRLRGDAGL